MDSSNTGSPRALGKGRRVSIAAFCVLAALWLPAKAQDGAQDAALDFIITHQVGSNLPQMAMAAASRTETFRMLGYQWGLPEARKQVEHEIARVAPTYQARWDQNLAVAYARHLSVQELSSLATEGAQSQYISKFVSLQRAVGEDMRTSSEPMLTEMVAEVLVTVYARTEE